MPTNSAVGPAPGSMGREAHSDTVHRASPLKIGSEPSVGARSLGQKYRALSLANIPSRAPPKPRATARDSARSPLRARTLSRRAIDWPGPPEAAYLLACRVAYRARVAVCTTSVATTLATTLHWHSCEQTTDPARTLPSVLRRSWPIHEPIRPTHQPTASSGARPTRRSSRTIRPTKSGDPLKRPQADRRHPGTDFPGWGRVPAPVNRWSTARGADRRGGGLK
jgi:hypothetical protein